MTDFIELGENKDAVIVESEYTNICGGYESTNMKRHGSIVYNNAESKVYLYRTRFAWVFGLYLSETKYFFSSKVTSCVYPYEAKWTKSNLLIKEYKKYKYIQDLEGSFVDIDFDAKESSLGLLCTRNAHWIRGSNLQHSDMYNSMVLFNKIEPNDVYQGRLGDCWLLSALSSLAEFPLFMNNVFTSNEISKDGKYIIKLYDAGQKKWIDVTIDDRIPCTYSQKWYDVPTPLYTRPHENELYILLLEKAFAKMAGSYDKLNGGHPAAAWLALTGCEDIEMWSRQDLNWVGFSFDVESFRKNPWNFQNLPPFIYKKKHNNFNNMFNLLKNYDKLNYIMEAAIMTNSKKKEHERVDGLIELHAYSLIAVYDDGNHKLVQLRNPWGDGHEWNGGWSDSSKLWDKYPEVTKKIRPKRKDDGLFWMPWNDFTKTFNNIETCKKSF
jgi:hypothetical protein